ncbi:MAG TPA: TerC family protein [Rhizomicrobium sp.]|nr:TerC family protein [Rhizomicrobium sp.]
MFELLTDINVWTSLLTLTVLEIVLGIDNIVFLSIASSQLPKNRRPEARRIGLALALIMRIALLSSIAFIIHLSEPIVTVFGRAFSWRDLVFFAGGIFLLTKGTREIHHLVDGDGDEMQARGATFFSVIVQIAIFDLVFSMDSVITAVGMAEHLPVMIAAVVIAIFIMLLASEPVSEFVHRYPTVKMLALSFLLLIGMTLVADALQFHIPRGYLYFAVGFSILVEFLNQTAIRRSTKKKS